MYDNKNKLSVNEHLQPDTRKLVLIVAYFANDWTRPKPTRQTSFVIMRTTFRWDSLSATLS